MKQSFREAAYTFLWLVPFVCFLLGYQLLRFVYSVDTIIMPKLVGRNLQEAVKMLSDQNLNIRITQEKETTEVPEGTILSQIPLEGQKIKPYQSIFLVVSQRSSTTLTPILQGLSETEATETAHNRHLEIKKYKLFSTAPLGTVIAQSPGPLLPLNSGAIVTYISAGDHPYRLMPDFKNLAPSEVVSFLRLYGIEPYIFHNNEVEEEHMCENCIILDQRPYAGTLVNISAPFKVQLRIGSE